MRKLALRHRVKMSFSEAAQQESKQSDAESLHWYAYRHVDRAENSSFHFE